MTETPLINVIIPYSRWLNYLTITLCTLREAIKNYPEDKIQIYLFDTIGEERKKPELAEGLPLKYYSVGPFRSIELMYANLLPRVFEEMEGNYLAIIEADACIHPFIFSHGYSKLINYLPDMGMGSVFHTPFHKVLNFHKSKLFFEKASLGFFGSIIRKDLWRGTPVRGIHNTKWAIDWSYVRHIKMKNKKLYCTFNSYIEHLGFGGVHKRNVPCPKFPNFDRCIAHVDRAINFFDPGR